MVRQSDRLLSLDAFRGGVIAVFIIQNNPGSNVYIYSQMLHSKWDGCTFTDWGFPFFLFIVGVSLILSLQKQQENHRTNYDIYKKILVRSLTLFVFGLLLENFSLVISLEKYSLINFAHIRILGVLQRIAITYFVTSLIVMNTEGFNPLLLWILSFLVGYWVLMMTVPVPGYGAGNLSKTGNLATYLDNLIMPNNLWKHGRFDPEGLLTTVPATATVLMGSLTGRLLKSKKSQIQKATYMLTGGLICVGVGLIAAQWFPFNKSLWTSSYALFTGGMALVILAILYWIMEIHKFTQWTQIFRVLGRNCLIIFVLSSLLSRLIEDFKIPISGSTANLRLLFYYHLFLPIAPPKLASLFYALSYLVLWMIVMWYLYKKRVLVTKL